MSMIPPSGAVSAATPRDLFPGAVTTVEADAGFSFPVTMARLHADGTITTSVSLTDTTTSAPDLEYPDEQIIDTGYTLESDDYTVTIDDAGHHLAFYHIYASNASTQRTSGYASFQLNNDWDGTRRSTGRFYSRLTGGCNETGATGGGIYNLSASDTLHVSTRSRDAAGDAGTLTRGTATSQTLMMLKLSDNADYCRLRRAGSDSTITTTTGPSSEPHTDAVMTWTDVPWYTTEELDTGSFTHTTTNAEVTLAAGKYLVVYSMYATTGVNQRRNHMARLVLDGTALSGSYADSYNRNNVSRGGMNGVCLVDAGFGGDLKLQIAPSSTQATTLVWAGNIDIVRLSDDVEYAHVDYDGYGADTTYTTTETFLAGFQSQHMGTDFSLTSNRYIHLETAGDYLVIASCIPESINYTQNIRSVPATRLYEDSSVIGVDASYIRNRAGNSAWNSDHPFGSNHMMSVVRTTTGSEQIQMAIQEFGGTAVDVSVQDGDGQGNRHAMFAIRIPTMFDS